jgi:hypothetical protein
MNSSVERLSTDDCEMQGNPGADLATDYFWSRTTEQGRLSGHVGRLTIADSDLLESPERSLMPSPVMITADLNGLERLLSSGSRGACVERDGKPYPRN